MIDELQRERDGLLEQLVRARIGNAPPVILEAYARAIEVLTAQIAILANN